MPKYVNLEETYDQKTLTDWYISSVDDNQPVWTGAHIEELLEDFYVIPKTAPLADTAPVVYGWWVPITESEVTGWNPVFAGRDPIAGYRCSNCNGEAVLDCNNEFVLGKYCLNCGATMGKEYDENELEQGIGGSNDD